MLDESEPSSELNDLLNKYWNVSYCMGSPLNRSRLSKLLGINNNCRECDVLVCFSD